MKTIAPAMRKWIGAAVIALCLCGFFIWRIFATQGPDQAESDFIHALAMRDWESIYRNSPQALFDQTEMTSKKFASLMNQLSAELPDNCLSSVTTTKVEAPVNEPTRGQHYFLLRFENSKDRNGMKVELLVQALRTKTKWEVLVNELPIKFAKMSGKSPAETWKDISLAMKHARIDRMRLYLNGPFIVREKIDRYVAGDIEHREIYSLFSSE